jgi:hypothetical protein
MLEPRSQFATGSSDSAAIFKELTPRQKDVLQLLANTELVLFALKHHLISPSKRGAATRHCQ